MKRILLLLTLGLILSCSDDDSEGTCNCDAVFVVGSSGGELQTETHNVDLNCSTGEPKYNPTGDPNGYFLHCEE